MKIFFALLLSLFACSARADSYDKLVGYRCDRHADRLLLTYDAAIYGGGQSIEAAKLKTQWDPWDLVEIADDDNIKATRTIKANCTLSGGTYDIQLGPIPGNVNLNRRCGRWISAWAEVRLGKRTIYPRANFESGVGCFYLDGTIITRVEIISGRSEPTVTILPAGQMLGGISNRRSVGHGTH